MGESPITVTAEQSDIRKHNDIRVVLYSLIIALGACAFGFDQSMTGGFLAMPTFNKDFGSFDAVTKTYAISAGHQTLMYGLEVAFILLGSVFAGFGSNYHGRKEGLYICASATIVGACIQLAPYYSALVVGRAVMGLSIGYAAAFTIAFWSEIATPKMRGSVVIFYQLFLNLANFIAACVDEGTNDLASRWAYRAPLLVMLLPPIFMYILIPMVPESPRWLVTRDQVVKAKTNLIKLRGPTYTEEEVTRELEETIKFTRVEAELQHSISYIDCFKGTDSRRTYLTILCMFGQQCMGVAFMAGYLTYFFKLTGLNNAFVVSVIATAVAIAGSIAAFPIVRYLGRRPIMIVGSFACGFSMLAFATVAEAAPGSKAAAKCIVAFISIFQFAYSASWGSVCPILIGEIPSNRLRSKTISIALCAAWCMTLLVICGTPYLINPGYANIGTKVGFIFGGLTVFVFIATVLFLPETKDRRLEEIDEMFLNRVPTRAFKRYVCTGQVADYDISEIKVIEMLHKEHA